VFFVKKLIPLTSAGVARLWIILYLSQQNIMIQCAYLYYLPVDRGEKNLAGAIIARLVYEQYPAMVPMASELWSLFLL